MAGRLNTIYEINQEIQRLRDLQKAHEGDPDYEEQVIEWGVDQGYTICILRHHFVECLKRAGLR